ncbi:MCE family protein [Mycolicibacterium helvum]|uniref:Mce family protein Mce3B n=1 Tax=Mycolicibacterium helvum TaxID=1534349 RepID=A0A7I7TA10_9MYCO|nr:MCE family protein [Mycolicibacterium helvum]BBY66097.1 Mce family protein Mce3B [Mycolicibacterium helvum]
MRDNLSGAAWRLGVFMIVAALGLFALLTIFAQFRFDGGRTFNAVFTNVTGLENGNFVRIAGVEVGKVSNIRLNTDSTVTVEFRADDSVVLTEGSRAVIRYDNVIGGRYLALEEGAGSPKVLPPGATIPVDQTSPALDLDALIGGFRPLFRALNPDQVNALSGQLLSALQGQGATVGSFLSQTAALTNTLADRDQLVGQVVANLSVVLGSLGDQKDKFGSAVDSLAEIVHTLQMRKTDLSNAVAYTNASAAGVADLLRQARPPLANAVKETDRTAGIVVADHDYVDNLLATLPDSYRILGRQGLNGDYFAFYICDLVLKLNGKGGQPVYVKLAGQDTGRCTPR